MIQLPEVEATARLSQMLQADAEPPLTAEEIADLLELARRADANGLAPGDTNWEASWDLNAAAAEGWRRKAGKVSGRFNVTTDGATLQRAQMFANCLSMAERYAAKVAASVNMARYPQYSPEVDFPIDASNVVGNL